MDEKILKLKARFFDLDIFISKANAEKQQIIDSLNQLSKDKVSKDSEKKIKNLKKTNI